MPYSLAQIDQCIGVTCCSQLQGRIPFHSYFLIVEATHSSETSVFLYQTILHYSPEDVFFSHRHELLESHNIFKHPVKTVQQCVIDTDLFISNWDYFFINCNVCGLGQHSWFSNLLQAGWSRDRIPVRLRFSASIQTGPGAHPASCSVGTGSFPGVKRLVLWC